MNSLQEFQAGLDSLLTEPSPTARQLGQDSQRTEIFSYFFRTIKPKLVFVHSKKPIQFFEKATDCHTFTADIKRLI